MSANTVHHIVFVDLEREVAGLPPELVPPPNAGDGVPLEYLGGVGFPHPAIAGAVSFVGFKGRTALNGPKRSDEGPVGF